MFIEIKNVILLFIGCDPDFSEDIHGRVTSTYEFFFLYLKNKKTFIYYFMCKVKPLNSASPPPWTRAKWQLRKPVIFY